MAGNTVATRKPEQAFIENAQITFRNFAGKRSEYNAEGDRNFALLLPEEVASQMLRDGWNVKYLKPRDEGDEHGDAFVKVKVRYGGRPPRIMLITRNGRTSLPEDMVELVDMMDIDHVDVILNPYVWEKNGNSGVSAYLQSIAIIIREDELERKYADIPEIGAQTAQLEIEAGEDPNEIVVYEDEPQY